MSETYSQPSLDQAAAEQARQEAEAAAAEQRAHSEAILAEQRAHADQAAPRGLEQQISEERIGRREYEQALDDLWPQYDKGDEMDLAGLHKEAKQRAEQAVDAHRAEVEVDSRDIALVQHLKHDRWDQAVDLLDKVRTRAEATGDWSEFDKLDQQLTGPQRAEYTRHVDAQTPQPKGKHEMSDEEFKAAMDEELARGADIDTVFEPFGRAATTGGATPPQPPRRGGAGRRRARPGNGNGQNPPQPPRGTVYHGRAVGDDPTPGTPGGRRPQGPRPPRIASNGEQIDLVDEDGNPIPINDGPRGEIDRSGGTLYGVPEQFRNKVAHYVDDVAHREGRRGRISVALPFFGNSRRSARRAVEGLVERQGQVGAEFRKWLGQEFPDLSAKEVDARVHDFELSTSLYTVRGAAAARTDTLVRKFGPARGVIDWWKRHEVTGKIWKKEFWTGRNLGNMAMKSIVLAPATVAAALGGGLTLGLVGGAAAVAATRAVGRGMAGARMNRAANAETVASDQANKTAAAAIAAYQNGGQVVGNSMGYLRTGTEGLVRDNRKRDAITAATAATLGLVSGSLADIVSDWFGGGDRKATWQPDDTNNKPPVPQEPTPPKPPIELDLDQYDGNKYVWGWFEDHYGAADATPTITDRIHILEANGFKVETWGDVDSNGDPVGNLWGVSKITAPNGQSFISTNAKVGILEYAKNLPANGNVDGNIAFQLQHAARLASEAAARAAAEQAAA